MFVNRFHVFALAVITLVLGYLGFKVMKPFLTPIAWASVLSLLFYPMYMYLVKPLRWKSLAAFVTLVVILIVILGPFSYLSFLLARELTEVAAIIKGGELQKLAAVLDEPRFAWLTERIKLIYNIGDTDMERLLVEALSNLGQKLMEKVTCHILPPQGRPGLCRETQELPAFSRTAEGQA
jgi:predicted PurR-regulated permease PerM